MKYIILLLLLSLMGCAPVIKDYHYLSFEQKPKLEVLKYGKSQIDNLFNHESMPITYVLKTALYELNIDLNTVTNGSPRIFLRAKSSDGLSLVIEGIYSKDIEPLDRCGLFGKPYPQDNVLDTEQVITYNWYLFREGCNKPLSKRRSFTVIIGDKDKTLLGKETLFFKIVRNGSYVFFDGI